jgi:response regulator RpfG family c-di-GMP phosphodiesterase/serine/threonine protein kinase
MTEFPFNGLPPPDTTIIVPPPPAETLSPAAHLLALLLDRTLILSEEWDELPALTRARLLDAARPEDLLPQLVESQLLTRYQAEAVGKGRMADLTVGHYRLLEPLGRGGMGVVYRAEHLHLRRPVALKLMAGELEDNPRLLSRFFLEAQAVARIRHPNLVSCLDAGRHQPGGEGPARHYYVMDLIPGQDLLTLVTAGGALPVHRAADVFRQVADALAEAHRHRLIHRDIKPGNVLVTPDWQGKLLDFGLALHPGRQMTEPGTLLGTVGYMAPEQALNPSSVDARADLFSLGATLFLAVSGRAPFPDTGAAVSDLSRRLTAAPPRVRLVRPELPAELDELIARLMDPDPERRYPTASAVAAALAPFQRWRPTLADDAGPRKVNEGAPRSRVLVADDEPMIRRMIRDLLAGECDCVEAEDGADAWAKIEAGRFDLAVVDLSMPGVDGARLIGRVRACERAGDMMLLLMSGHAPTEALGGMLLDGADDFVQKPFLPAELRSRVRGLLARRKSVHSKLTTGRAKAPAAARPPADVDRAGRARADTMRMTVTDLTRTPAPATELIDLDVADGDHDPVSRWDPTAAQAMAAVVSLVLQEGNLVGRGHGSRLPQYLRVLAAACPADGEYARLHDPAYLDLLAAVLPLHDLGHLMLPTELVQKPALLTADERMVVQTHCTAGSEVIVEVAARHAGALPYLTLAAEVVRGHHERWDGQGYPDMLGGSDIPLSARVASVITVYDSLRSRRPYRPGLTHPRAVRVVVEESAGQFDPVLLAAFKRSAQEFDQVFQRHTR